MKFLSSIFFVLLCYSGYSNNTVYDHLVSVNHCWTEQTDLLSLSVIGTDDYNDHDWIKLHLSLVEQTLRNRSTSHLSFSQKANRNEALDRLHEYWLQGNFPINDKYSYRTPIFIDDYNNFCAVGYLVKATGHENVSRLIAANTNLAYVREMNYPQLNKWTNDYGFSTDELAWIQPGYGPVAGCGTEKIGNGTNGEIHELYVNNTGDRLYVGGSFTKADSTLNVNNLAYVTEAGGVYTWHDLGGGVNGKVYAIHEFQGKVFVGGSFTLAGTTQVENIAYWDGNSWQAAGCTYGTIKDLIVYNNELYAAGDFDICAAMSEVNIAKWNGTMWSYLPNSNGVLNGHVNTLEEHNGELLLGGNFSLLNDTVNIAKWSSAKGFETYTTSIKNEVTDIAVYKNNIHAVCKRTSSKDSNLIQVLSGNTWGEFSGTIDNAIAASRQIAYNTICTQGDTVLIGGDFETYGMMNDPILRNAMNLYNTPPGGMGQWPHYGNWFMVDDAINKMVVFKNDIIFAGRFKNGMNNFLPTPLNHIGKKTVNRATSVKDIAKATSLNVYPNPVNANSTLKVDNKIQAKQCVIRSVNGAKVFETQQAKSIEAIPLPDLPSGSYFIELRNSNGERASQTIVVK